nr:putative monothiol glutaredoxin ycf64 like [Cystoclonium purpureum f. stellatum]
MNNQLSLNIHDLIQNHKIIVFMKGDKIMPSCGFSNTVIQILNKFNISYYTVNVLKDDQLRDAIKKYSKWPTIPQVYINGEFMGGADIIQNLYETSELHEILEKSISS